MRLPFLVLLGLAFAPLQGLAGALDTFTLPAIAPGEALYHPNVQSEFPAVDWSTLDRLYIPANTYRSINIGGLPVRDASRPLVISNSGGQVKVGGSNPAPNYLVVLQGGAHWRFTGEYDAAAGTGHANFPGHAAGYAGSRGRYGIFVDDARIEGSSLNGIVVSGEATRFTLDHIEVARVGFDGIRLQPAASAVAMQDVRIHDTYIHDVGGSGVLAGSSSSPPQARIDGLRVYNNRVARTALELFQINQGGGGTDIRHNVFFLGGLDWKSPFSAYQDSGTSLYSRAGSLRFRNNIVIGGVTMTTLFGAPVGSDPTTSGESIDIRGNYFSHGRARVLYAGSVNHNGLALSVTGNQFTDIDFQEDEIDPGAVDNNAMLYIAPSSTNPVAVRDNRWDGSRDLVHGFADPNQTVGNISGSGNTHGAVPNVRFVDSGLPSDIDYLLIEQWGAQMPGGSPLTYQPGDYALYEGQLYRNIATAASSGQRPDQNPQTWQLQPLPPDDLRLAPDSPVRGAGLLDSNLAIFGAGFE